MTVALLMAAITGVPTMASAQQVDPPRKERRAEPDRKWRSGERFDSRKARAFRQIDYRQYRKLKAPPKGHRWVRSGRDAVLIRTNGNVVVSVSPGLFR